MINGFHKQTTSEQIAHLPVSEAIKSELSNWVIAHKPTANTIDKLSENTIAHFGLPLGIAPNFKVNQNNYFLPLVTEESSVVAAISKAANFWHNHNGFMAELVATEKKGQVHFFWKGNPLDILNEQNQLIKQINQQVSKLTCSMEKRGGGISEIRIINKNDLIPHYFQLDFSFKTADAMGANFINSVLEQAAITLEKYVTEANHLNNHLLDINMAILSNYTPNCRVIASCSCSVDNINLLGEQHGVHGLANKMVQAYSIAKADISRTVTHNKGIFNGIDALALATGNDWRAIESSGHAWAAKSGTYTALSTATIQNNLITFKLDVPMAVGTVGGVSNMHPTAKFALQLLKNPDANELMKIMTACGLAANFSAILSLTTTGIQKGHMKMHLSNILHRLSANNDQIVAAHSFFKDKTVSHSAVADYLSNYSRNSSW